MKLPEPLNQLRNSKLTTSVTVKLGLPDGATWGQLEEISDRAVQSEALILCVQNALTNCDYELLGLEIRNVLDGSKQYDNLDIPASMRNAWKHVLREVQASKRSTEEKRLRIRDLHVSQGMGAKTIVTILAAIERNRTNSVNDGVDFGSEREYSQPDVLTMKSTSLAHTPDGSRGLPFPLDMLKEVKLPNRLAVRIGLASGATWGDITVQPVFPQRAMENPLVTCLGYALSRDARIRGLVVPPLPDFEELDSIGLTPRVRNSLRRRHFLNPQEVKGQITIGDLAEVRGMGVGGIVELLQKLASFRAEDIQRYRDASQKQLGPDLKAGEGSEKTASLPWVPDGLSDRDPRYGKLMVSRSGRPTSISALQQAASAGTGLRAEWARTQLQTIHEVISTTRVPGAYAEFKEVFEATVGARNAEVWHRYYGSKGGVDRVTMSEVAGDLKVSTERVRQITVNARKALIRAGETAYMPCIDAFISALNRASDKIETNAVVEERWDGPVSELVECCEMLAIKGLSSDAANFIRTADSVSKPFKVERAEIVKLMSKQGFFRVSQVLSIKGASVGRVALEEYITQQLGGRVIGDEAFANIVVRNRLLNNIAKVLFVSPQMSLLELRGALTRSYRLRDVPSVELLQAALTIDAGFECKGGMAMSTGGVDPLSESERALVATARSIGPLFTAREITSGCMANGMSQVRITTLLSGSPLIMKVSGRFYALIGTKLAPSDLRKARERTPRNRGKRTSATWGWAKNRQIYIRVDASESVLRGGSFAVPKGLSEFVEGEFESELFTLSVQGAFAWGFGKLSRRGHIALNDEMVFTLNLEHRTCRFETCQPEV
ncbi:MAG: hypothetical protein ABL949_06710 [Fimbriimonadaceae bacterium]